MDGMRQGFSKPDAQVPSEVEVARYAMFLGGWFERFLGRTLQDEFAPDSLKQQLVFNALDPLAGLRKVERHQGVAQMRQNGGATSSSTSSIAGAESSPFGLQLFDVRTIQARAVHSEPRRLQRLGFLHQDHHQRHEEDHDEEKEVMDVLEFLQQRLFFAEQLFRQYGKESHLRDAEREYAQEAQDGQFTKHGFGDRFQVSIDGVFDVMLCLFECDRHDDQHQHDGCGRCHHHFLIELLFFFFFFFFAMMPFASSLFLDAFLSDNQMTVFDEWHRFKLIFHPSAKHDLLITIIVGQGE
mmetsp:Transcript_27740/g.77728  ORF Transcript_27740/g.77728 Transcript_27740/m.77728 type:complete len:297 (-) Transcript_27740:552-1442(-)